MFLSQYNNSILCLHSMDSRIKRFMTKNYCNNNLILGRITRDFFDAIENIYGKRVVFTYRILHLEYLKCN